MGTRSCMPPRVSSISSVFYSYFWSICGWIWNEFSIDYSIIFCNLLTTMILLHPFVIMSLAMRSILIASPCCREYLHSILFCHYDPAYNNNVKTRQVGTCLPDYSVTGHIHCFRKIETVYGVLWCMIIQDAECRDSFTAQLVWLDWWLQGHSWNNGFNNNLLCRCSSVQGLTLFLSFCEINLGSISLYIWIDGTDVLAILFSMEPVDGFWWVLLGRLCRGLGCNNSASKYIIFYIFFERLSHGVTLKSHRSGFVLIRVFGDYIKCNNASIIQT